MSEYWTNNPAIWSHCWSHWLLAAATTFRAFLSVSGGHKRDETGWTKFLSGSFTQRRPLGRITPRTKRRSRTSSLTASWISWLTTRWQLLSEFSRTSWQQIAKRIVIIYNSHWTHFHKSSSSCIKVLSKIMQSYFEVKLETYRKLHLIVETLPKVTDFYSTIKKQDLKYKIGCKIDDKFAQNWYHFEPSLFIHFVEHSFLLSTTYSFLLLCHFFMRDCLIIE